MVIPLSPVQIPWYPKASRAFFNFPQSWFYPTFCRKELIFYG